MLLPAQPNRLAEENAVICQHDGGVAERQVEDVTRVLLIFFVSLSAQAYDWATIEARYQCITSEVNPLTKKKIRTIEILEKWRNNDTGEAFVEVLEKDAQSGNSKGRSHDLVYDIDELLFVVRGPYRGLLDNSGLNLETYLLDKTTMEVSTQFIGTLRDSTTARGHCSVLATGRAQ